MVPARYHVSDRSWSRSTLARVVTEDASEKRCMNEHLNNKSKSCKRMQ